MTNFTTKPICFLGQPCLDAECDYCNPGKLAAVRESARAAFFPAAPGRQLLAGVAFWKAADAGAFDLVALPPKIADVFTLANLAHERILAGGNMDFDSGGTFKGYWMQWVVVIELPLDVRVESVKRRLRNAFRELGEDPIAHSSFNNVSRGKGPDEYLTELFEWNSHAVTQAFEAVPEEDRGAVDLFLNSVRSGERIFCQNMERTADGLFLATTAASAASFKGYRPHSSLH